MAVQVYRVSVPCAKSVLLLQYTEQQHWNSLPPDITSVTSDPTLFLEPPQNSLLLIIIDHFLPKCFQFVVLYTMYSTVVV